MEVIIVDDSMIQPFTLEKTRRKDDHHKCNDNAIPSEVDALFQIVDEGDMSPRSETSKDAPSHISVCDVREVQPQRSGDADGKVSDVDEKSLVYFDFDADAVVYDFDDLGASAEKSSGGNHNGDSRREAAEAPLGQKDPGEVLRLHPMLVDARAHSPPAPSHAC